MPFAAWLYRIAANEIADRAHRAARKPSMDPPDDPKGPCYEEIENRARLFRMVEGLPVEQRRVIMLRFAEERSIREIAGRLNRTEGAVKQLQFRALESLRTRMEGADV